MEYFILYLCSIADSLQGFFNCIGFVILVGIFFVGGIGSLIEETNFFIKIPNYKGLITVGIISLFIGLLIPSSKQCYAIFGVGTVLNYVNNSEEAKQIPDNAMKAVNRYLESLAPNDSIQ